VRLGVVAALAAGMIGGVAVAAGTGVLPTPFRDDSPHPAATISAAQTPRQPSLSPSPGASKADGSQAPVPGATTSAPTGSGDDEAQGPGAPSGQPDSSDAGRSARAREWWAKTRSYCRDVLDGKTLESGRRRVLVDAAGGGRRVTKYCKGVLGRAGANAGEDQGRQGDEGADSGSDQGAVGGSGDGSGNGSGGGDNGGDGDGHTGSGGTGGHHGILAPSPSAVVAPLQSAL
jgi:hypothetical protein